MPPLRDLFCTSALSVGPFRGGRLNRVWNLLGWRFVALALAVLATVLAHSHVDTSSRVLSDDWAVPRPTHAKFSALGFESLVSDYYWLLAVQIVGGDRGVTEDKGALIGRLIDVVTTLDPWVDHPYRFAAVWLTGTQEDVATANRLLERGIAYHPTEWRNHYYLGFNHFFYFEDYATAADVLEVAVQLPGSPPYLGALVARLRAEVRGIDIAASFLADLARNTEDEFERASLLKALDEVETERRARVLDAARAEYSSLNGRDIERVEDLLSGTDPVLGALPGAHPHFADWEWVIDRETGLIVSSFYGSRYELHFHPLDKERRDRFRSDRRKAAEI